MDLLPRRKFACSTCPKKFRWKKDFARHVITHDPDAKVKCKICGKISKNPIALSHHMKNLHTNRKRPICEICRRVFHNSPTLRRHIKTIHSTSERPRLPCGFPGCEKTFQNKQHVSRHVSAEHAENPVRFRCTLCEKEFKLGMQLEQHIPTHTTEKPYNCATCGKSYALRGNMIRHEKTHLQKSARDKLQCTVCFATLLRDSLQGHIRVVHENRRNYPCTFCDKRFPKSSELKRHVDQKHAANKEKIHTCDKCEYKSHSKVNLAWHVKRHNPVSWRECYFCGKQFARFQELVKHCNRVHTLEA
ncbi:PR domain zinc finger protein 5 [Folsomia candida]|uniref:C2H2-type domain-containing protein n=1 Tax=Folsomia candida TaxID=158441 RepID=A0A226DHL4_FOLCA|nr:PR domain zinc finger protein 5 [Folsomia candida]XP_035713721.1 PR domain zinc finger protein 5 [Folsomia candida]XP_035713722.1 PR domain zinc finger protein 5 [Folsomia candida]OXA45042.1 hypothetical protein Fcan01_19866 [Folsomia candida]